MGGRSVGALVWCCKPTRNKEMQPLVCHCCYRSFVRLCGGSVANGDGRWAVGRWDDKLIKYLMGTYRVVALYLFSSSLLPRNHATQHRSPSSQLFIYNSDTVSSASTVAPSIVLCAPSMSFCCYARREKKENFCLGDEHPAASLRYPLIIRCGPAL